MDIQQYLDEEVKESLHEIIRGNVLLATRYFNYRVKKIMDIVAMGHNNPMMVQYYTYKVEFQERGAGHIHGTLWLDLKRMEKLIRTANGDLVIDENIEKDSSDVDENSHKNEKPFEGINSAFKKMKNNQELTKTEKEALKNFIDEFTTVSTNQETVGERVSRIVREVNIHSHTKSCRKYDCPCRFFYPRFPSIRTIIAEPMRGMDIKKKKEKLKEYEKVLSKVKDILMDSEAVERSSSLLEIQLKNQLIFTRLTK